ncbi:aspartyl-phosphate phosphatase Spo0E family protein [Heyndrickxia coagulans]|uniref:aspartyl-phosphate phosphatase Spo0E family protein n=1 Tax=Heyndrickxia coagulans TaxID=1398 RepID=UPI001F321688|nr:aspartyl-phosphate phosphatase Spo0E family protein [Heyndrickxia coagulans]UJZ87664.1 aspartyl-phosphate phosphatase Spo0E family protein [Heyndrickxia coagulans]
MNQKSQALMLEIEEKRHEMIQLASTTAYWDDQVLQASRHLDQLINQFNKLKSSKLQG